MESNSQTAIAPDVLVEPKTIGWLTLMVLGLVWLDYWIHGPIVSSLNEIVLFSAGTAILAISNFIPQFKYNQRYTTYLIVYHVAIFVNAAYFHAAIVLHSTCYKVSLRSERGGLEVKMCS